MSLVKYRVKEVAADFGVAPKEIAEVVGKFFEKPKSNTQVLTDEELNVVFDYMTQNNQIESLEVVFAVQPKPKAEEAPKAEPKKEEQPKAEQKPANQPKAEQKPANQPKAEQPKPQADETPAKPTEAEVLAKVLSDMLGCEVRVKKMSTNAPRIGVREVRPGLWNFFEE